MNEELRKYVRIFLTALTLIAGFVWGWMCRKEIDLPSKKVTLPRFVDTNDFVPLPPPSQPTYTNYDSVCSFNNIKTK